MEEFKKEMKGDKMKSPLTINYRKNGVLEKAGLAQIKFSDIETPVREDNLITLPEERGWELYQLDPSFEQFLIIRSQGAHKGSNCWFGGTDEQPFLVRMNDHLDWVDVWKKDKFLQIIKPDKIQLLEAAFGNTTKRQGDIFALELPEYLQDRKKVLSLPCFGDKEFNTALNYFCKNDFDMFGTRHILHGERLNYGDIGYGMLKAPDHADLVLDKFCFFAQTKYLHNPEKAD